MRLRRPVLELEGAAKWSVTQLKEGTAGVHRSGQEGR